MPGRAREGHGKRHRPLRRLRPKPSPRWHLDEMVIRISGNLMHLWRAVHDEGEVLEVLVQRRRDKAAALTLMRKLLKKHGFPTIQVTTDKLRSYGAAFCEIGLTARHEQGRRTSVRAMTPGYIQGKRCWLCRQCGGRVTRTPDGGRMLRCWSRPFSDVADVVRQHRVLAP